MSCLWFCFMMFMYAQLLTMFNVGCMGYEWYFQLCDFPAQEINMMCCEFLKWFAFHAHGFVTLDMKPLGRVAPSRFDHLYSNKTKQNKKEKNFTLFPHSLASRTYRDITYGIRAKGSTLGPDGLIDIQVCCEQCDLNMRYHNYLFECTL